MDIGAGLLFPIQWLVSAIMLGVHDSLSGLDLPAGWTWSLSIIGLVLIIRAALIPVSLQQIRAQRRMRLLQPELKKLEDKYRGNKDPLLRQAMAQEQMALYKEHGTNPWSACLPMLIQVPFFLALFSVLSGITTAAGRGEGIGAMSHEQVVQFEVSSIFGAPLSATVLHGTPGGGNVVAVWLLSIVMILAMTASQFITQKHMMAKAVSEESMAGPFLRQRKAVLYSLPIVFGLGGIIFPIGVLIYWTTTNLWTMVQQFVLDPRSP